MGFHPPQLPKELRDHIYQTGKSSCTIVSMFLTSVAEGLSGGQRRRSNRKDSRKQERLQQKRKNREHLSKNDTRDVPSKRRPDLELSDGPRKRVKLSKVDQSTNIGGLVKSSTGAHQSCSHDDALSLSANRSRTPKIDPIDLLQNGQATDEAEEGWLESKLGYSNGQVATKSYGFQYEDDGLDGEPLQFFCIHIIRASKGRKDLLMTLDGIVGSVHRQHGPAVRIFIEYGESQLISSSSRRVHTIRNRTDPMLRVRMVKTRLTWRTAKVGMAWKVLQRKSLTA